MNKKLGRYDFYRWPNVVHVLSRRAQRAEAPPRRPTHHTRTHARTHAHTHARTYARMHACTHARTHTHARTVPIMLSLSAPGGPSVGKLLPGDQLIKINGQDVKKSPREYVIDLVR
jgi:hypothetical protein